MIGKDNEEEEVHFKVADRRKFNADGSVKDGVIEIQGDHRDKIKAELEKRGHSVKLAGG